MYRTRILFLIGSSFLYTQNCHAMKKNKTTEKMVASWTETAKLLGATKTLTLETSRKLTIQTTQDSKSDTNTKKDFCADPRFAKAFREANEIGYLLKSKIDSEIENLNPERDIEELCEKTTDTEVTFSRKFKKVGTLERDKRKEKAKLFCLLSILCPCAAPCLLPAACYNCKK